MLLQHLTRQPVPFLRGVVWAVCLGLVLTISSCRKGELQAGELPETQLFLDRIQVPDSLRLSTVVELHWTGFVRNAYITGFEVSTNGGASWGFTPYSDSTFVFTVPAGNQIANIEVYVRAMDNYGRKDPSPAYLSVPVKNTPPVLTLSDTIPDTALTVLTCSWQLSDPDGESTLDSVEIQMNGGTPVSLPPGTTLITLVPVNPDVAGASDMKIYRGTNGMLYPFLLPGAMLDGTNQLSIRVKDKSGAFSPAITTSPFYLKKKNADLLVLDAYPADPAARALYASAFGTVYPNYDFISLLDNNRKYQPKYWNLAFKELISLYDKVIWYSNRNAYNTEGQPESGLLLETACQPFQQYLNQGGKLLVLSTLPVLDTSYNFVVTSPVFTLLPIDTLSTSNGQARLQTDSLVVPASGSGYPVLRPSQFMTGLSPFAPKPSAEVIYSAQITPSLGWVGPSVCAARSRGNNGKTQLVYFSLEMHLLNANGTVPDFFQQVLNTEFNW